MACPAHAVLEKYPLGSLSKAVSCQKGCEPRGLLHASTSACRGQPVTRRRRVISPTSGMALRGQPRVAVAEPGGTWSIPLACRDGARLCLPCPDLLSGSSFRLLAGLEVPSLTCGLEIFPVNEDAGKSQGILALNVKSIEMLEKPWMLPSHRSQASCREPAGEPGLFQRAEKTRACPVL